MKSKRDGEWKTMERAVTQEERQALLDNPQLVMFHAKERKSRSYFPLIMMIATVLIGIGLTVPLCFTSLPEKHPVIFSVIALAIFILVLVIGVNLFLNIEDAVRENERETHCAKLIRESMPRNLVRIKVTIDSVVYEKCEGTWIVDGKEEFFGYVGFRNTFKLVPGRDLVIVTDRSTFSAYIKRDAVTESLYER